MLWGSKIMAQKDIEATEWVLGFTTLVLAANNPSTMHELSTKAAKRIVGEGDMEEPHE